MTLLQLICSFILLPILVNGCLERSNFIEDLGKVKNNSKRNSFPTLFLSYPSQLPQKAACLGGRLCAFAKMQVSPPK